MSAAANAWPAIIARHPGLVESLAAGKIHGCVEFPMPVLCGFLSRLERRFHGMTVSRLHPTQKPATGATYDAWHGWSAMVEWTAVLFQWDAEMTLAAGLLPPETLPQGRKRLCYSDNPFGNWPIGIRKRARGILEVSLGVPTDAASDHPLALFSPSSVRAEARTRAVLRLVVDNTRRAER